MSQFEIFADRLSLAPVALHFFAYNFITFHKTLKMPPALKAKVTDYAWSFEELVEMIDQDIRRRATEG